MAMSRGGEEGSDLATEGEGDGTLGLPESEGLEDPSSRPIGAAATALGASGVDGGARGGRPKEEVGAVAEGGAAEGSGEGALQEVVEPDQRGRADLSVREDPRSPVGRGVFLSEASSLRCGRKTAAAAGRRHTDPSAVSPSSRSNPRGKEGAREHSENSSPHVRRPVAKYWIPEITRNRTGFAVRVEALRAADALNGLPRKPRDLYSPVVGT